MSDLINSGQPFTKAAAAGLAISEWDLKALVEERQVRRVFKGVYVDSLVADTRQLRASALHLVGPKDAVFYGATVAFLFGIDVFAPKDRFTATPHCIVPHGTARCKRDLVKCREGYLPEKDLEIVEGLIVTTPVRTAVDLLRTLWRAHALAAADSMAHAGLITKDEVLAYIRPMRRYPGIVQARALARLIEPLAESPGESWQRLRMVDAGFPVPQSQIRLRNRAGRVIVRLDNGYKEKKVGVEYDGREFHDDEIDQADDEEKREYCRKVLGWRLAIAKYANIFGDDPAFEGQLGEWIGIRPLPRRW